MKSYRVLCIEDDAGTARLMREHLENLGYDLTHVYDGESGLAETYIRQFDVVLIDYMLPNMSGIEVIRRLHTDNEFPPATILVTGEGDERLAVQAMKAGADDYVVKDVKGQYINLLIEVIAQVLKNRDLQIVQHRLMLDQAKLIQELRAFSYAVAHDLKQPLALLLSSLDLLMRYSPDQFVDKAERKLPQMHKTVLKMNSVLDALILFARVRDIEEIDLQIVDMDLLIQEILVDLSDMIAEYEAEVIIQSELPKAYGQAEWVRSIWMNYFTNAIKYGGTPPTIKVGATLYSDNIVSYWVKDNGDGLTPAQQEKIFLPFSRLMERKVEGHGLGLAIVRQVARRLGGDAFVSSRPGQGSTFSFTLLLIP